MGKIAITINGERTVYTPRTSWVHVDTGTFQRLQHWDKTDWIDLVSKLYGIDYAVLEQAPAAQMEGLFMASAFVLSENLPAGEVGTHFMYEGTAYLIPKSSYALTVGQAMEIRKYVEGKQYVNECLAYAIAVYMQPIIDGVAFSSERAQEIATKIEAYPITKTFAVGSFFLRGSLNYGKSIARIWKMLEVVGVRKTLKYLASQVLSGLGRILTSRS